MLVAGGAISVIGVSVCTVIEWLGIPGTNGDEGLLLIVLAWVGVGLMRLCFTGMMWLMMEVVDWLAEGMPDLTGALHFMHRLYWIVIEACLSASFLVLLMLSLPVGLGLLSMEDL